MKYDGFLKRAFDVAISTTLTAVTLPITAPLTLINTAHYKENPFYCVKRVGKNGKIFHMIKFRSMFSTTDREGNLLSDDQRVSLLGKFLRYTSIDEVPQLLNIIKGDMSIVGPRPETPENIEKIPAELAKHIISVKPGLTGPWQVSAIGQKKAMHTKPSLDAQYARNGITFKRDISYIWQTLPSFFKGHSL